MNEDILMPPVFPVGNYVVVSKKMFRKEGKQNDGES
jgi:hypothetical protein